MEDPPLGFLRVLAWSRRDRRALPAWGLVLGILPEGGSCGKEDDDRQK